MEATSNNQQVTQSRREGKARMSFKSGANLVNSRKNHLKEDVPDFPKEAEKLWGQDTKHQSTLWETKAVRQSSTTAPKLE